MYDYIEEGLWSLVIDIDEVMPDPKNARVGHDLDKIAKSLQNYKQRKPIVVNKTTKHIEAGNGTWKAAKEIGWLSIAVLWVEDSPEKATGYSIADNRLTELSEWDDVVLFDLLQDMPKEYESGFTDVDVEILKQSILPDDFDEVDLSDIGSSSQVTCPNCGSCFFQ